MTNPILLALDLPDLASAEELALEVKPHVGGYKVGLELIMNSGPDSVGRIAALGLPVFADVKLHDIPNTVREAARAIASQGARWLTVHASGGRAMIEAAAEGMNVGQSESGVLAVTVLTSLDEDDLVGVGQGEDVGAQIQRLAGLASNSGAEGVICAPGDVRLVKTVDSALLAVTPGIRTEGSGTQDQKRVASPKHAIAAGADYLVIGRSITAQADAAKAAEAIYQSL